MYVCTYICKSENKGDSELGNREGLSPLRQACTYVHNIEKCMLTIPRTFFGHNFQSGRVCQWVDQVMGSADDSILLLWAVAGLSAYTILLWV